MPDWAAKSGKDGVSLGPTVDPRSLPRERVDCAIEKPVVRELRIAKALELDAEGRAMLRRGARGFLGPNRELVVIVSVKR